MAKVILSVLFLILSAYKMDRGLAAVDFSFSVRSLKPAVGFRLMQMACNSSKRPVLISMAVGSEGEGRIIVHHLEYDTNGCHSAPPLIETIIDIDLIPFQTAPSSPDVGGGGNNGIRKVDSVDPTVRGFHGGGPGDGGGDPDDGGGGPNSEIDSDRDGRNRGGVDGQILDKFQINALKKLAKISIFISAQTGTSLLGFSGKNPKPVVYFILAIDVCAYLFCMFAMMVGEHRQMEGAIMAVIGSLCAALGFLLTMFLIIPLKVIWVLVVALILPFLCLILLSRYPI